MMKDALLTSRGHHNGTLDKHGTITMLMCGELPACIACLFLLEFYGKADYGESLLPE